MPQNSCNILNLNYLNRLMETTFSGLGKDSFGELIDIFQHESLEMIRKSKESLATSSFAETRKIIHSLKGSSANMGASLMLTSCENIEKQLGSGTPNTQEILEAIQALQVLLGQTVQALKDDLKSR